MNDGMNGLGVSAECMQWEHCTSSVMHNLGLRKHTGQTHIKSHSKKQMLHKCQGHGT